MATASKNGNEPIVGMRISDLDKKFFAKVVLGINPKAELVRFTRKQFDNSEGVLANLEIEEDTSKRLLGLRAYQICYNHDEEKNVTRDVVIKIKPIGYETWQGLNALVQNCGEKLGSVYKTRYEQSEICNAEKKDMVCVSTKHPVLKSLMPETYHVVNDPDRQIFAYAMEDLRSSDFTHLDKVNDVQCWHEKDIKDALESIASFHALHYGRLENIPENLRDVLDPLQNRSFHTYMVEMWEQFINNGHTSFPDIYDAATVEILNRALENVGNVCDILEGSPQTVVHNDFNVRNACLRKNFTNDKKRLCLYDWELVRYGVPQHDVAEFLVFSLPEGSDPVAWQPYIDHYRACLKADLQKYDVSSDIMSSLDAERFQKVFDMSVVALLWNRLPAYLVIHKFASLPFITRVIGNGTRYLRSCKEKYTFL